MRERILAGGGTGCSKTFSYLKIVQHLPNLKHYAIEVDDGMVKLLTLEFPDIPATIWDLTDAGWVARPECQRGDNLTVLHCRGWSTVMSAQRQIEESIQKGGVGEGSWLCIDGMDLVYNSMRYEYLLRAGPAMRKTGGEQTAEDEWQAAINRRAAGAPILEPSDWDAINSFWENFLHYVSFQIPMHLYCTTSIEMVDLESRYVSKEAKELAKLVGINVKFEGQKKTPRVFDTLLGFKSDPQSGYAVHLWKDRGGLGRLWSQQGQHSPMMLYTNNDFYSDIGVKLFGWQEPGK